MCIWLYGSQVAPRNKEDSLENGERALNAPIKLRRFVELTMDIASGSPRRYFFEVKSPSDFSALLLIFIVSYIHVETY